MAKQDLTPCSVINGVSRDYDNVGNTTQRDGVTYTYSGRNRLSRVSMGRTTYYSNTYNARGEREEKSLTNGMTVQRFIYDEAGRLIQTGNVPRIGLTRTLKPEQRLLWLDDQLVGVKIKATTGAYAGELLYAHTDHLGTPRALMRQGSTGNLGVVVWRWPLETSAFGQHPAQSDPDGDGQVLTFNLRYPGQYFDSESGLHYNSRRDYDSLSGRYIQSDPIGLRGGLNTYSYIKANPLNGIDPSGLLVIGGSCEARRSQIEEAERQVKKKLDECSGECGSGATSCVACEDVERLKRKLERSIVDCTTSWAGEECGFGELNGWHINVSEAGFMPKRCGCVAATIFHEMIHNIGREPPGRCGRPI